MTQEQEPKEVDLKLAHILYVHLLEESYMSLLIALIEAKQDETADDRFAELVAELTFLSNRLMNTIEKNIDTIPGMMSREEADVLVTQALQQAALLKGLPVDMLLPEEENLH